MRPRIEKTALGRTALAYELFVVFGNCGNCRNWRAASAEAAIIGIAIDEKTAEVAGDAALSGALPLPQNRYIAQIVRTLVKRAILACK